MLLEQTIDKLYAMKLDGMAAAIREQMTEPAALGLSFDERLGLIVDRQWDLKETRGLRRRLQVARLRQQASVEDIDFSSSRGLDRSSITPKSLSRFTEIRIPFCISEVGPFWIDIYRASRCFNGSEPSSDLSGSTGDLNLTSMASSFNGSEPSSDLSGYTHDMIHVTAIEFQWVGTLIRPLRP